jgi:hypothetical protein
MLRHTSVICDSFSIHRWKRNRVLVNWGMEEQNILGFFELAILVKRTLVRVRLRHIEGFRAFDMPSNTT